MYKLMKNINIILFLIIFSFVLSEAFVFGQPNRLGNKNKNPSNYKAYREAITNLEDKYEAVKDRNAAYVHPRVRQLLEFYKTELTSNPGSDLESRIADLQNVLEKTADMYCTADEEDLNGRLVKLNLAFTKYNSMRNSPNNLGHEIEAKEQALRQSIIKAIEHVLATNGICDNEPSKLNISEDR